MDRQADRYNTRVRSRYERQISNNLPNFSDKTSTSSHHLPVEMPNKLPEKPPPHLKSEFDIKCDVLFLIGRVSARREAH